MDDHEFKRILAQVKPTPEQEQVILNRLLADQKEVKPMKRMKKLTAVAVAAALLLLTCAFTVAVRLNQKFAALFGAGEQEAELIAAGVVQVDQSHTYENGWTIEVEQVLADRYTLAVLMEVSAPEGSALWDEDCYVWVDSDLRPEPKEKGVGGWVSGSTVLPDQDPDDRHVSILWHRGPTTYLHADPQIFLGRSLTFTPICLESNRTGELADFSQERHDFCVRLPEQDSGRQYQAGLPIQVGKETMSLRSLYLSPISVAFLIQGEGDDPRMWGPTTFSQIEGAAVLNLSDGQAVSMGRSVSQSYDPITGAGTFIFQLDRIVDPDKAVSMTILDQTLSLEGLPLETE